MNRGYPFLPNDIRIAVPVLVIGSKTEVELTFCLDTGATRSSIRPKWLEAIGIDLSRPTSQVNVRGVIGVGRASCYELPTLSALGRILNRMTIIAQEYPRSVTVDGLLGLDFLRGQILTINFSRGRIVLRPPHPRWQFWR